MQNEANNMANGNAKSSRKTCSFWMMAFLVLLTVMIVSLSVFAFLHHYSVKQVLQQIINRPSQSVPMQFASTTPATGSRSGLISRGIPAFSSGGASPASNANDGSYDTSWRSQGTPAWLAYDLTAVPVVDREKVLVIWYNQTGNYDHTIINDNAYNNLRDYAIEVNAARGGGNVPNSKWVVLVKVTGNTYHSRQHVIDMNGYNWIRIYVTSSDGSAENMDAAINMDVYTAEKALADDWIFYGDSITAMGMDQYTVGVVPAFANLINAKLPDRFPVQEGGGIGYLTSGDGVKYIPTWLSLFPGKYVGLSYGTNDANSCIGATVYYNNYVTMVQAVLKAGKIPIVPKMPWSRTSNIQSCGPALIQKIEVLYQAFPRIIHGPDLWTFFKMHQNLVSGDDIHPTNQGLGAYRQQWVTQVYSVVYKAP
jgi:lysophospholipase L1-like esterase